MYNMSYNSYYWLSLVRTLLNLPLDRAHHHIINDAACVCRVERIEYSPKKLEVQVLRQSPVRLLYSWYLISFVWLSGWCWWTWFIHQQPATVHVQVDHAFPLLPFFNLFFWWSPRVYGKIAEICKEVYKFSFWDLIFVQPNKHNWPQES